MQIISEVVILGCIDALPANGDLMGANGSETYPYFLGRAYIQHRTNTEGIICILSLPSDS